MSDIMDPSKLKVAELRAELQARGLDSKGNKPVLVDRLRAALEEEAECEEGDDVAGGEEEEEAEQEEEFQEEVTEAQVKTVEEHDAPVAVKEPEPPQQEPEVAKKSESPVKKTASPQKEPESSPKRPEPEPSRKAPEPEPEVKTEPEDSAKLGYEDAPMEELADKSDAGNGMDVNVKEEELEVKEEAVEVKQEVIETEESGSTSRRGEKRALSRSRSPEAAPDAKKQRPEVEEVRVEDEPEVDKTVVALDWYNSDLSLVISKEDFLSAQPLTMQGFGYVWHGVRATYGFTRGRVFFEAKVEDYMPVPQLEEDEQHPHVLRVGWSVDDAGLTLGEDPFSYGYGGTGKASTNLKFKSYGRTFGKGDVLGCFLDLESEPVVMSFTVNGQHQGIAYEVSHSDLGDQALFPHIVTKNTSFRVNFGSEPAWMEPLSGYTFTGKIPLEDRVLGTQAPEKREDAEDSGEHSHLAEEEGLNEERDNNESTNGTVEQVTDMSEVQGKYATGSRPGASKRKIQNSDLTAEVLTTMRDHFKKPNKEVPDRYELFGKTVACRLRGMKNHLALITEKKINDILFDAEIGQVNSPSGSYHSSTPSPYNNACTAPSPSPTFDRSVLTNLQHGAPGYSIAHSEDSVGTFFSQYNPNM